MSAPILATKLYILPPRPKAVLRPRLIERLNEGLSSGRKLTLISAPAGFGKTTLVSEWVATLTEEVRAAWLSLDEGDTDPTRFLVYLVAALQTVDSRQSPVAQIGAGVLSALQSPQPAPIESLLTNLLNEITAIPDNFIFVLDDYHVINSNTVAGSTSVDAALTFLVDHLPPQMQLVIVTREDPSLPLARYRARGQLTELRAADLRFTPLEAADFLNRAMGLNLSPEEIAALETRTEGWIAGLQFAALALQGTLSIQGHPDAAGLIQSFTGSHHFVLDYLVEEVLERQPESVQTFLLRTSILDRLCGSLCEAVMLTPSTSGQATAGQEILEYLEHANLFLIPLDNERHWYRYHHLFSDLLQKRLGQGFTPGEIAENHIRASEWYEKNGLEFEAFHHATAANDVERAERLMESKGMSLHVRSVATAVLNWLASLPATVLDARPLLWVRSATLALMGGQTSGVEEKLQAAEAAFAAALQNIQPDARTRDLIGQIACARATLALTRYDPETMITQSRRALEYLHPDNLPFRFTANWALASASLIQGDRAAASRACMESVSISQKSGDVFSRILATSSLGQVQELENQLYLAAETYRSILPLFGDHPQPNAEEVYLGLARIFYEWNDLESAEHHGQQGLQFARQYDRAIDRFIISEVFLARLKMARGDLDGAAALLAQVEQSARQQSFLLRMPEIAAAQALILLRQSQITAAAQLAQLYNLPLSQARVYLAQGNPASALAVLAPFRQQMEAKGWADERLKAMVLQAVAFQAHGEIDQAVQVLGEALALARPGGFIRSFVDEGPLMARLLREAASRGIAPEYIRQLLAAFPPVEPEQVGPSVPKPASAGPLSERELEVLHYIAEGLTNPEIAARLYLSLYTVKAHARNIYSKLDANNRTQAVARARELGILGRS